MLYRFAKRRVWTYSTSHADIRAWCESKGVKERWSRCANVVRALSGLDGGKVMSSIHVMNPDSPENQRVYHFKKSGEDAGSNNGKLTDDDAKIIFNRLRETVASSQTAIQVQKWASMVEQKLKWDDYDSVMRWLSHESIDGQTLASKVQLGEAVAGGIATLSDRSRFFIPAALELTINYRGEHAVDLPNSTALPVISMWNTWHAGVFFDAWNKATEHMRHERLGNADESALKSRRVQMRRKKAEAIARHNADLVSLKQKQAHNSVKKKMQADEKKKSSSQGSTGAPSQSALRMQAEQIEDAKR
jgi:hypothetical protein